MAAKEAQRQSKVAEERDLQSGLLAGFMGPIQQNALPLLAFLAAIFVFYFPALSGEFVWDDIVFSKEKTIQDWSGLWDIWFAPTEITSEWHYWPVTHTTFWLDHKLFGLNPLGYHIVNCILYFINIVLIWRLLLKLEVPGAWAISMIFAVHPIHVESVAWLIERKSLLSAMFYLGSIHLWLRFRESSNLKAYALALGLYVLGLLSKSIVVTLPVALLVLLWWKQERVSAQDAMRLLPFFIVGFAITLGDYLFYIASEDIDLAFSFLERVLLASQAVWFYVGKLLWPANLMVIYPHWDVSAGNLVAWLFAAATVGVLILLWGCRHRIGKGPLAGIALFVITLSPILGFVDYGYMEFSFVADRYQYLAGLGLLAVFIGGAVHVMRPHIASFRPVIMGVYALLVAGLGILTWQQATIYQDEIALFSHIVTHNPAAYDAYHNLGIALFRANRVEEAYEASLKAVEYQPNNSKAHSNVAHALIMKERYDEAEESLKRALELDPKNSIAWRNSGVVRYKQQRYEEAVTAYQKAVALSMEMLDTGPDFAKAYAGMGDALLQLERHEEAIESLERSIELHPSPPLATASLLLMGRAASELDRLKEAAQYYERAIELDPQNLGALELLAATRFQEERYEDALRLFTAIRQSLPEDAYIHSNIGATLHQLGRLKEAARSYETALSLDPNMERIRSLLEQLKREIEEQK